MTGYRETAVPDQPADPRPFPASLCHSCAAPPRYVTTERSVFILCPLLPDKYPRQSVQACELYRKK